MGRVGQYGKGGAQGRPVVHIKLRAGFFQLVGNHPFARPAVHKNDLLAWVPLQNEPDGVFVKALSTDDAHPIMGKIAAQFAGSVPAHQNAAGDARTHQGDQHGTGVLREHQTGQNTGVERYLWELRLHQMFKDLFIGWAGDLFDGEIFGIVASRLDVAFPERRVPLFDLPSYILEQEDHIVRIEAAQVGRKGGCGPVHRATTVTFPIPLLLR